MCGRFTNKLTWDEIVRLYRLSMKVPPHNLPPRYNICPTDPVDVVTERDGNRNFPITATMVSAPRSHLGHLPRHLGHSGAMVHGVAELRLISPTIEIIFRDSTPVDDVLALIMTTATSRYIQERGDHHFRDYPCRRRHPRT